MKKFVSLTMIIILIMAIVFSFTGAQTNSTNPALNISSDNISYALSNNLYGLSLDNMGYALNGGLVSDLVNNNSFELADNPTLSWSFDGVNYTVATEEKMNDNNKNYLHLTVNGSGTAENNGFTEIYNNKSFQYNSKKAQTADMGFSEDETYLFSAFFKNVDYVGTMTLSLNAVGNTEKYQFNIDNCGEWTKVTLEIKSNVTADGALKIDFEGNGNLYMDSVSLVPISSYGYNSSTWKYTSLRNDLVDAIKLLSPSFIRFSEITSIDDITGERQGWKTAIGPLETRKSTYNKDATLVNSNAMGFYEYLILCEELGAMPVPVFDVGHNFTKVNEDVDVESEETTEPPTTENEENTENTEILEVEPLEPAVQDILDFIEYAMGDETTTWGEKRVADGHAEPFKIEYIALNSDSWSYGETDYYDIFSVVSEKYPKIKVILNSGKVLDDESFNSAWKDIKTYYNGALVNEYYGGKGISLYNNVERYDQYERSGPKVVVDSYLSGTDGIGTVITGNNIWSAIENMAFLTGLERNADLVTMASYKCTLAKRNAQVEKRSLIWFDSQDILLTSDYYAQMLFANNYGTNYVSTAFSMEDEGIYQSTTVDTVKKVIYVKLVNTTNRSHRININLEGFKNVNNPSVQYMTEKFKSAHNDFDEPLHSAPKQASLTLDNNTVVYDMGGYSISVVRIPYSTNDGTKLFELPETELVSPYIHPAVNMIIPISLVVLLAITGVAILVVRIRHHKAVKDKKE